MEYRRRRRPARTARQGSLAGTVLCLVLLTAAIVYLIGVSSAGTWVAQNVVAPVFKTLGIAQAPAAAEGPSAQDAAAGIAAPVTKTLQMPGRSYYMLQMGAYASAENASKQAAALQSLGAGGYIYEDQGKYRVLAACYLDAESIAGVRGRLSDEGLESTTFLLEQPAAEWIVTASDAQIEALSEALEVLSGLNASLYDLVYAFDREQKSVAAGKSEVASLSRSIRSAHDGLQAAVDGGNDVSTALLACCESILEQLNALEQYDGMDTTVFTAKLKYAHLSVADAIGRLAAETGE